MNRRTFLHKSGLTAFTGLLTSRLHFSTLFDHQNSNKDDDLVEKILDAARSNGAQYADIRVVKSLRQTIQVQKDVVSNIYESESFGYGLRVIAHNNYGFIASDSITDDDIKNFVSRALEMAKARSQIQKLDLQFNQTSVSDTWQTPISKDPFTISLNEKIDFLKSLTSTALSDEKIEFAVANFFFVKEEQLFASTTGSKIRQTFFKTYPNFAVTAVEKTKGVMESRSSFIEPQAVGYEITTSHPLLDEVREAVEEAKEKLNAPSVSTGTFDLILAPSHLWHLLNETLGYHLDPDNVLGFNENNPYEKLFSPSEIGTFQIASESVSIKADNTLVKGLATAKYDDEGNLCSSMQLIDKGILASLPMNQEMQSRFSKNLNAFAGSADGWSSPPLLRVPNLVLQPIENGPSLDQLIAQTSKGILIKGRGNVIHNYDRKAFQVFPPLMWLIENGKIIRMLRNISYQSRTLDFWKSCSDVGRIEDSALGGSIFMEKGEPIQQGAHSVSCSPAVFKNIQVIPASKH